MQTILPPLAAILEVTRQVKAGEISRERMEPYMAMMRDDQWLSKCNDLAHGGEKPQREYFRAVLDLFEATQEAYDAAE